MPQSPPDPIEAYDVGATLLAAEYEALDPSAFRTTFSGLLPTSGDRLALDVGAGSGRDAAWLCSLGFDVVAVEPATGMREEGLRRHGDAPIRWIDDRLPGLLRVHSLGLAFDLILLSAVWQHVSPVDRPRAIRKLATLLKPGGLLVITLRHGPAPLDRPMHEVSLGEVEALARAAGLSVSAAVPAPDTLKRPDVHWTTLCLTLPDDGAGALPLLRGIILNDSKAATYKLGLVRAVARLADQSPSLAVPMLDEDRVEVPLGAVAVNWLRSYLPLVRAGLPQTPTNRGADGLGFAGTGFRALLDGGASAQDLRVGAVFHGDRAEAVCRALAESARTIARMPANFIRLPNSDARVFAAATGRGPVRGPLVLEPETLRAFGSLSVPGHVWRAMLRLSAWIEPVLVAEWGRLVRLYAERQGRTVARGEVETQLTWMDPSRDVRMAREAALGRIERGEVLRCVWSDRPLSAGSLDVDHCLPWAAWPCGDLWNLLPAHRLVNQRQKRDLLPSGAALTAARHAITGWWQRAWGEDAALAARFEREARAALLSNEGAGPDSFFEGLEWRRLRLRQDQQIAEWAGVR